MAALSFIDTDGDHIEFRFAEDGRLQEFLNSSLAIAHVRSLQYSRSDGTVRDDTGDFTLPPADRVELVLAIRALAAEATGLTWVGEEPPEPTIVTLVDIDGDELEFSLSDSGGALQAVTNGQPEDIEVRTIRYSAAEGRVTDENGTFVVPSGLRLRKVSALRAMAASAGVEWLGDSPLAPVQARPAAGAAPMLEIEDCDAAWEYRCPKRWEELARTDRTGERFCNVCQETVFFCTSAEQVQAHASQRRCVAYDVVTAAEAPSPIVTDDGAPAVRLQATLLSGEQLPEVLVPAAGGVQQAKAALALASGIPAAEQRLVAGGAELDDCVLLAAASGVLGIHLIRVDPPQRLPPRRLMGKRRGI